MRKLIIRLSSLGDVILATAALDKADRAIQWDWVVAKEYEDLLKGHPKLSRVWGFDRRAGLFGWIELCRELWKQEYDQVVDLHSSLRSRFGRFLFFYWDLRRRFRLRFNWKKVSKQRFKFYGYCCFKRLWPKVLRPTPWIVRFSYTATGEKNGKPNLKHLVQSSNLSELKDSPPYICVMPSSRWPGKRWPVKSYLDVLEKIGAGIVILGTFGDEASKALIGALSQKKISHISGVGKWKLSDVATALAFSKGYLGNDTGLAHMAEAVGVPAVILVGPTSTELGFGPWGNSSVALSSEVWCSPCGKDGRACFRVHEPYICLKGITHESVAREVGARLR